MVVTCRLKQPEALRFTYPRLGETRGLINSFPDLPFCRGFAGSGDKESGSVGRHG